MQFRQSCIQKVDYLTGGENNRIVPINTLSLIATGFPVRSSPSNTSSAFNAMNTLDRWVCISHTGLASPYWDSVRSLSILQPIRQLITWSSEVSWFPWRYKLLKLKAGPWSFFNPERLWIALYDKSSLVRFLWWQKLKCFLGEMKRDWNIFESL